MKKIIKKKKSSSKNPLGELLAETCKIDLPKKYWIPGTVIAMLGGVWMIFHIAYFPGKDPAADMVVKIFAGLFILMGAVGLYFVLTQSPWSLLAYENGIYYERGSKILTYQWADISELKIFVADRPMLHFHLKDRDSKMLHFFLFEATDRKLIRILESSIRKVTYWQTLNHQIQGR